MSHTPKQVPDSLAAEVNDTLRATVAGLAGGAPFDQLLGRLLQEAGRVMGAHVGMVLVLDRASGRPRAEALLERGRLVDIDADPLHRVWRGLADSEGSLRILSRLRAGVSVSRMADIRHTLWEPGRAWHDAMGHRFLMMVPVVHRGQTVGALGLGFADQPAEDPALRWALDALIQQLALVVVQASEADRRAEDLRRSDQAMQRVIDAMASLGDLNAIVPAALKAAADALDSSTAAFFEHEDRTIYLRFWLRDGQVVGPDELPNLGDHLALMRDLAAGFEVPFDHLGEDMVHRQGPVLIDHATATASPALHRFACDRGWRHELNAPLLADGRAAGAITFYRPDGRPFDDGDLALAAVLCKQLALALQAGRVAARASELAVAEERARLAADIHDSLAQSFTSIALQCEVLADQLPTASAERRTAEFIERTARLGLAEARASVHALRSLPEGDNALAQALTELAERCDVRGSLECRFEHREGPCPLGPAARETVFRVAQEAASNAMRHAHARHLWLRLDWDDRDVVLTVRDDGRGLDAAAGHLPEERGYGLRGMVQRAAGVGGSCLVQSDPGQGVIVTLRVPRSA